MGSALVTSAGALVANGQQQMGAGGLQREQNHSLIESPAKTHYAGAPARLGKPRGSDPASRLTQTAVPESRA